jgi:mRNA interferase MazF
MSSVRMLQQGQIRWARLPPPAGVRPVLVLTRSSVLTRLASATVAPLTRTDRDIPSEVRLTPADGVPTPCVVSLDNIATIRKELLAEHITTCTTERMAEIFAAIRFVFAMPT